jgi:membrane associated rhomboid family serine protease
MDNNFKFSTSVLLLPMFFVLILWMIFWFEISFHSDFANFGILPRTLSGLRGIIFSPFIHGNFKHLVNNSLPLFILLAALRFFYREQSLAVIGFGILLSGLITWIIGRQNYHIGASSLIYVLVSFMFFKGIFTKHFRLVALSLFIVVWYGSSVWYLFPLPDSTISWEGHLAGFITGLILAKILKTVEYQKPIIYEWEKPDFNPNDDEFMKNFDENGNFIVKQKDGNEEEQVFNIQSQFPVADDGKQYIYHYKKTVN